MFDYRIDSPVTDPLERARADAILLFDGVFLQRAELASRWDFVVFVHADFDVTLARARQRDLDLFGSSEAVEDRYHRRYVPGQRLYLNTFNPRESADIVIDNNDFERAFVVDS